MLRQVLGYNLARLREGEEIEARIKQDAMVREGIDRAKEVGGMPRRRVLQHPKPEAGSSIGRQRVGLSRKGSWISTTSQ
jgi:hypothetical protein